jgi:hypothetical protein
VVFDLNPVFLFLAVDTVYRVVVLAGQYEWW